MPCSALCHNIGPHHEPSAMGPSTMYSETVSWSIPCFHRNHLSPVICNTGLSPGNVPKWPCYPTLFSRFLSHNVSKVTDRLATATSQHPCTFLLGSCLIAMIQDGLSVATGTPPASGAMVLTPLSRLRTGGVSGWANQGPSHNFSLTGGSCPSLVLC